VHYRIVEKSSLFFVFFLTHISSLVDDQVFYTYNAATKEYNFWRCAEIKDDNVTALALKCHPFKICGFDFSEVGVYIYVGLGMTLATFKRKEITGKAILAHGLAISIPKGTINELA
jgi:hypothetical protein